MCAAGSDELMQSDRPVMYLESFFLTQTVIINFKYGLERNRGSRSNGTTLEHMPRETKFVPRPLWTPIRQCVFLHANPMASIKFAALGLVSGHRGVRYIPPVRLSMR